MNKKYFLICSLLILCAQLVKSEVRLPAMMGDNMILQQNSSVNIWGWADGKRVSITTSWDNKTYQASTDNNGAWLVKVDTPDGGYAPYTITISDGTPIVLSDVLIGEVWVCSGQSNMEMPMKGNMAQPIDNSLETLLYAVNYSNRIRFITVPRINDSQRRYDFEGRKWEVSNMESVANCSAACYFFAKQLTETLDIPIGLVINSWGGSRIESWMNEEILSSIDGVDIDGVKSMNMQVQQRLSYLYDTMLYPIINYSARGFLWYQGESNIVNHQHYSSTMSSMIAHWRELWESPDMPFYCVHIAPYQYKSGEDTGAAQLREAQVDSLKSISNAGIISTIDIGDKHCIHPPQKDVVGLRLATLVLSQTYGIGSKLVSTGPMMTKVDYSDGKAIVTFNNAVTGLQPSFRNLEGFEIAGSDKKFYPAKAKTVGRTNTVEVYSDQVSQPVAVRYAFHDFVEGLELSNTFGLAAFPFRTDSW